MQGGRNIGHFGGGEIIAAAALAVALLTAGPPAWAGKTKQSANQTQTPGKKEPPTGDNYEKPIPILQGSFPNDAALAMAAQAEPAMVRDFYINAPRPVVRFFTENPLLAFKIARELLHVVPLGWEREENGAVTIIGEGSRYTVTRPEGKDSPALAGFAIKSTGLLAQFQHPNYRQLRTVAHGVLAARIRAGDDDTETALDYDLRLAPAGEGMDQMAAFSAASAARKEVEALFNGLKEVCEEAADDPSGLAEDMAKDEEIFTAAEVKLFRERMAGKGK